MNKSSAQEQYLRDRVPSAERQEHTDYIDEWKWMWKQSMELQLLWELRRGQRLQYEMMMQPETLWLLRRR